ncbi:MAG: hypothetical protein OXH89_06925 [bacterium]|nr:hypothetical protein [bacterium]
MRRSTGEEVDRTGHRLCLPESGGHGKSGMIEAPLMALIDDDG